MPSTASVTILTWRASSFRSMSPAAGGEPALDLVQAIRAPERLAVDDDVGRAENAALDRGVYLDAQPLLHRRVVQRLRELALVHAELCGDVAGDFRVRDV